MSHQGAAGYAQAGPGMGAYPQAAGVPYPQAEPAPRRSSPIGIIAAVGAAALFVPFPSAVDDHQTTNARFLVDAGGGWLVQQTELTPELLADLLQKTGRPALLERALKAKTMQKTEAVDEVVRACEELAK